MARLAIAVGYLSKAASRTEEPELLYLGHSYQAAKDAAFNPPAHLGFAQAFRIESLPKNHTVPDFVPPAAETAPDPVLDLLPDPPKPAAKKAAAKEPADY